MHLIAVHGAVVEQSTYTLDNHLNTVSHTTVNGTPTGGVREQRDYDSAGRLTEVREYFGNGEYREGEDHEGMPVGGDVSGWIEKGRRMTYDADGRLVREQVYGRRDNRNTRLAQGMGSWLEFNPRNEWIVGAVDSAEDQTQIAALNLLSDTRYGVFSGATLTSSYYDANGRLTQFQYQNHLDPEYTSTNPYGLPPNPNYTHTYAYTYKARESFMEASVSGTSTDTNFKPATTTSYYDRHGNRVSIKEDQKSNQVADTLRYFSYDMEGRILTRRDGSR